MSNESFSAKVIQLLNSLDLDTVIPAKQVSKKDGNKKSREFEELKKLEKEIERLQSALDDIQAREPSTVTPKAKAREYYNLLPISKPADWQG